MKVRIQVIKVYDVEVSAEEEGEAIDAAFEMQTVEIEERGELIECMTDFAEDLSQEALP